MFRALTEVQVNLFPNAYNPVPQLDFIHYRDWRDNR